MNAAVTVFFLIIKVFSLYFLAVSLFGLCRRRTPEPAARLRRFAVLIAARNEESCIAGRIERLRAQHYPLELVDSWVLPNNCTDRTAEATRRAGAQVLEMPASVRSTGAALHTAAKALKVWNLPTRCLSTIRTPMTLRSTREAAASASTKRRISAPSTA